MRATTNEETTVAATAKEKAKNKVLKRVKKRVSKAGIDTRLRSYENHTDKSLFSILTSHLSKIERHTKNAVNAEYRKDVYHEMEACVHYINTILSNVECLMERHYEEALEFEEMTKLTEPND